MIRGNGALSESGSKRIARQRSTGVAVKETSYYTALANLLKAVGQTLKPRVRSDINLKYQGAGMPDGGRFTPDQFPKDADVPLEGGPPTGGAIECKGSKDWKIGDNYANLSDAALSYLNMTGSVDDALHFYSAAGCWARAGNF